MSYNGNCMQHPYFIWKGCKLPLVSLYWYFNMHIECHCPRNTLEENNSSWCYANLPLSFFFRCIFHRSLDIRIVMTFWSFKSVHAFKYLIRFSMDWVHFIMLFKSCWRLNCIFSFNLSLMIIVCFLRRHQWTFNWAAAWDYQQCSMCDQQRLRPACAYAQSGLSLASRLSILWLLSY